MTSKMNDVIRSSAGVTRPVQGARGEDDLSEDITPDADQGRRNGHVYPTVSMQINDQIRRAVGISVRPGQRSVPEIGVLMDCSPHGWHGPAARLGGLTSDTDERRGAG